MILDSDLIRKSCPDLETVWFENLGQWREWKQRNPKITNYKSYRERAKEAALSRGIDSLWFRHIDKGQVLSDQLAIQGPRWIFERHRMLLDLIAAMPATAKCKEIRIYAAEALSPWALQMRGRFPRFLGSEYGPKPEQAKFLYPIPHQDLMKLSLPDGIFDIAVTQEVLEHVSDLAACLGELARILRPGGILLSTFPFLWNAEKTQTKARLVGDRVEHLADPEYHLDPLCKEGALVFQLPGWDILGLCCSVGFKRAQFLFYSTVSGAVIGQHLGGLWCLVAER